MSTGNWREVNKAAPCPICGKPDWCGRSDDGAARCMRIAEAPAGWRVLKRNDDGGTVFRPEEEAARSSTSSASAEPKRVKSVRTYPTPESAIAAAARAMSAEHIAHWIYQRGDGSESFIVARFMLTDGGKAYRPIHHNGAGFVIGDPPGPLPLYRLPDLQGAGRVYVCEGEKCADAAASIGLIATTSAHGSKSAAKSDWQPLAGKDVMILPDHDEAGAGYAASVAGILHRLDCIVRIVHLPNLSAGGDIADWIGSRECVEAESLRVEVERLAEAAPIWQPPLDQARQQHAEPIIVRLDQVRSQPLRWLWPGRFPLGKVSCIAGDPGLGKSLLTIDMAARVSSGTGWPDQSADRHHAGGGGVVLLTAEDDLGDTVRPRLDAANADCERIIALSAVKSGNGTRTLCLATDLPALERAIESLSDCRLVVIDPISAYLGSGKVDSHNNSDVRAVLAPVSELAARHGIAVVCVSHLNKGSGGGPAIYRTMGSLAFVAAARAAWIVTRDKDDARRRLMLPQKCNLAPDVSGLAYSLHDTGVGVPCLAWEAEPVNLSADEALVLNADDGDERSALEDASDWLRSALADGPMPADEVKRQAKQNSIAEKTLNRAKKAAGVSTKREGFGPGAKWYWALPDHHRRPENTIEGHTLGVALNGNLGHLCTETGGRE